jgi:hypothetical protein
MKEPPTLTKEVAEAIEIRNGGLYCLGWYLAWTPYDKEATLDGEFTAADLRSIADYMDYINEVVA